MDSEADAGRYGPLDNETYTLADARADARLWAKNVEVNGASRGWRVCCAMLEAEIERLTGIIEASKGGAQ